MSEEKNKKITTWLRSKKRILIGLGTLILICFMFIIVDFYSLILKISEIGILGISFFVTVYILAFFFRAYKLKLIIKGLDQEIKYQTSFFSIGVCFFLNDLIPGKLGDLAKIGIVKDQENIKLSESVCGIMIERVLDLIILFVISGVALIYLYFNIFENNDDFTILGQNLQFLLAIGAIIIVVMIFFLSLVIYRTQSIIDFLKKFSNKLATLLGKFIINFKEGMKNYKNHKKELIYIIILGFITWILDAFIIVIFFYFLGYRLNIIVLILAVILLFFSKIFTITPGGWGISENVGALVIFLFYPHIPFLEILSVFIIDHLFRSVFLFFYGGYSMLHYNFKLKKAEQAIL